MYLRFVVPTRHPRSARPTGLFSALYALEDRGELAAHEAAWFREMEAWFTAHLPAPGAVEPRAVSWVRASATDHVTRFRELAALLRQKDVVVEELRTERPGYLVYADEWQVLAIPFADTP